MDNQGENHNFWFERNKKVFIILGIFLIMAIVIVLIFITMRTAGQIGKKSAGGTEKASSSAVLTKIVSSTISSLPASEETQTGEESTSTLLAEQLAEKTSFGSLYHPATSSVSAVADSLSLPQNAKTEVANYYDVDRKISLDSGLASLNNNGFALLDNPLTDSDNFFSAYSSLQSKQVPIIITGDFLIYYYQNVLKQAYKSVESTVFYENLWSADLRLYQIAKQRYEGLAAQGSGANDVSLEASRLEMAYFATALSLLAPTDKQISSAAGLSDSTDFSSSDASKYSLQIPSYLQDDVNAEVNLIRSSKTTAKSPVMLYNRDYSQFAVPVEYQASARLNNFYLAARWLNSVFPLYYRDASCPDCLLDKDDWRIDFAAAFLISTDLSSNQSAKNRWAKIYKLQSFFSGLRDDLDYLNYNQVFKNFFSDKSDISQIIQGAPADNDGNLAALQKGLAAIDFSALQGALSKTATSTKPQLGLKVLTDSYWPDNYIFSQLTYPLVGDYYGSTKGIEKISTACELPGKDKIYSRCTGSAYDMLNLISPLNRKANSYFASSTAYAVYDSQADNLRKMLKDFTVDSWHVNIFWSTLDIAGKFLNAPENSQVNIMKSQAWKQKEGNTVLASWAGAELSGDIFTPYRAQDSSSRLNQTEGGSLTPVYPYIEPDLTLCRELIANAKMVSQMISLLNTGDGENTALTDIQAMENNLESVEKVIIKELQGQSLTDDDNNFINDLARTFSVSSAGEKYFELKPSVSGGNTLRESISGVKLLVYTFVRGNQKLFAVGPEFNFWEEKKH
jgi:hypothetical protein